MAKIEIEERAFNEPRLRAASAKFRVSGAVILGYAAVLWRFSQQARIVSATKDEIISWLDCDRYSKPKQAFEWLLAAEFLSKKQQPENEKNEVLYEIRGNSVQNLKISARIEKARSAAKSRIHTTYKSSEHATSMPYKDTSIQEDKKTRRQENREELKQVPAGFENEPPPIPKKSKTTSLKNNHQSDGSKIWSAYTAAYLHRYGIEPKRNATTSSQCSNLAKRLGVDDAIAVVEFYLSHPKSFYLQQSHAIGICLKDAEPLYTQMKTNNRVTATKAADIDRGMAQADVFERVTRKLELKYEGK